MDGNSTEDGWSRLGLFLSRDVLERRYRALHGAELSSGKAAEIIAHLQQAQQYFRSAESAGVLAGPLEQYYGVVAFSRAIVLYRKLRTRESNLKPAHGLKARLADGDAPLENISLTIENGTFHELLEATGNSELAGVDEHGPGIETIHNRWRAVRRLPPPQVGAAFRLTELLARIPDARQHFEEAFAQPAHCYAGRVGLMARSLTVTVWRGRLDLPAPNELHRMLGIDSGWTIRSDSGQIQFRRQLLNGEHPVPYLPNLVLSFEGMQHTVIEPFPGGWCLSELCCYAAASHVMSMLVRYYPTRWARLLSHERGDGLLAVLEHLRRLLQRRFVRLVLWELEREEPEVEFLR